MVFGFGFTLTSWASPQTPSAGAVPVTTIVSVEAKRGKEIPEIQREDVRAFLNGKRVPVASWVPVRGDKAGLELFILIDESLNQDVSLQFDDLRKFINAQPRTTTVGVGYMRNGTVEIAQNLTADHALAGKALRLTLGAAFGMGSPYLSLSDLAKRWPESPNRHAVLMISDGIDQWQTGFNPPYLDAAVERAQRAGIQVYAIYASGMGHSGHSMFRINWGQNNMAQLSDETGGEAYVQGLQTAVSFSPYLDQIADRLTHQYMLTLQASPGNKANFQSIRLETEVPNAELITADKIYVPAAK
jgi:VWFA-related protein